MELRFAFVEHVGDQRESPVVGELHLDEPFHAISDSSSAMWH